MRWQYLYSLEGLGGLWISLAILIVETIIIVLSSPLRTITPQDLATSTPQTLILVMYIVSVFAVPALFAWRTNISRELADIQRHYAPKALIPVRISELKKRIGLILISIPSSVLFTLIGLIYGISYLCLLSLIPVIILAYLVLKPYLAIYKHKTKLDNELCWLLVLLIIAESVGAGWRYLSRRLVESKILPATARELEVIDRDTRIYFPSHIDAMIHRSSLTPNERFGRLLAGYASRIREGGNVLSWLYSWLREEFVRLEFSYKLFAERIASLIGQIGLAIYAILPLISISMASVSGLDIVTHIVILATPLLTMAAYVLRPRTMDKVDLIPSIFSFILLISISILLYRIIGPLSLVLGWCLALIPSLQLYTKIKECEVLQVESIEFLREIIELKRCGYTISAALRYIAKVPTYSSLLRKYLTKIVQLIDLGIPLTHIATFIKTPSFVLRYTLFSLGLIHECGGGNIEAIQHLYESLKHMHTLMSNAKRASLFFDIFAVINTVIVAVISKLIMRLNSISSGLAYSLLSISLSEISSATISLILLISALGYSVVSTTVRRGIPLIEPRQGIFLGIATAMSTLV